MTINHTISETDRVLLAKLPKVELHVHLDGSVKPETIMELGQAGQQHKLETTTDLLAHMQVDEHCSSLVEYLAKFSFVLPYLQTQEALERVAYELVEQAAAGQVRYIEVRFAPMLHVLEGLSLHEVIQAVRDGLQRGEQQFGTIARAIIICMRHHTIEQNLEVIKLAAEYHGQGVVAVDLAGDEAGFAPERFVELFQVARQHGLPVTIHAGEAGGAENIRTAIEKLGAMRIGHGVRMLEDESVVALVKERGIPLEMCPLSNIQTKAMPNWESYPLRQYLEAGIVVTVNTDNMTVSDSTLQREYELLMSHCGITLNQLAQIIMNGAESVFAEQDVKQQLIASVAEELKQLGLEFVRR